MNPHILYVYNPFPLIRHFLNSHTLYKWNLMTTMKADSEITVSVPSYHRNHVHIKHSQNGIITEANGGKAFHFSTCIFDRSNIYFVQRTWNQPNKSCLLDTHFEAQRVPHSLWTEWAYHFNVVCLWVVCIWCECGGLNWIASMRTNRNSEYHNNSKNHLSVWCSHFDIAT